jgi:hypothetical protein
MDKGDSLPFVSTSDTRKNWTPVSGLMLTTSEVSVTEPTNAAALLADVFQAQDLRGYLDSIGSDHATNPTPNNTQYP